MATSITHSTTSIRLPTPRSLKSVWVIIPVYDEEDSLPLVLRDLPSVGQVIVVDNGSTDRSAERARQNGATVVREPRRGYGSACLAGLTAIQSRALSTEPPEVVVFLDGDYSDHPDQLPELVQPILDGEFDFVIGSRMRGEREPGALLPQALFGNRLACCLMWLCWGARFSDLGPFRAISWAALQRLGMCDRNFGWTVEMQIKATVAGLRSHEIPVRYRRRIGTSKISGTISGTFKAGYKILYTIARYRWLTWWPR
jgi:glycosyltransferase involved in cell wall biosynthesis